jgi:hypothetical protein
MEDRLGVSVIGPHQTRPPEWPREATVLADELEAVFAGGAGDLSAVVAGLNARGTCAAPDGGPWTEPALRERLAELGS